MKRMYTIATLIVLAILVTAISICWTPNMILCIPALVFYALSLFKSKETSKDKSVDLHLISLSTSAVIMVLQIFATLGQSAFACNLTALIMSMFNSVFLFLLWKHSRVQK